MAMLELVKRLLDRKAAADPAERERMVRTATAALLVEMVRVDATVLGEEAAALHALLSHHFGLSSDEAASLIASAEREVDAAASLYTFVKQLNGVLDEGDKVRVLEMLWRVALSDQQLDRIEETLVRKVGDLLKLPSNEVLRTKLMVQTQLTKQGS